MLVHRAVLLVALVAALLGLPRPALAGPYGSFVTLPSAGLPSGGDVSQVAVNANGELFATVYGDGVYRSTDGGSTFTKLAPPNFGMTNDIPNKDMMTMIVNALGEPIIGCREEGAQPGHYVFRLDWQNRTWVASAIPPTAEISTDGYDATGSQSITLGGVTIPKQRRFPRHFTLDNNGTIWTGWSYAQGLLVSFDNGNTFQYMPVPWARTGTLAGTKPGNVYSFNYNPKTGEYFYGTELIGFWHSTDGGNSWTPLDPTGTSYLGTHQNDYSIGFNRNQEPIFSNWGRSSTNVSGGRVFTTLNYSGVEVAAANGLKNFQFNKQNVFYQYNGGDAIMRIVRVDSVGYNFISAYSSNYYDNPVPNGGKQTVYLSRDGYTWSEAEASQPFVSPYCNSLCTDGTDVFVGATGKVWKFVINVENHLPQVTLPAPGGTYPLGTTIPLAGTASDADADALSFTWGARGPGQATFYGTSTTLTSVSFDTPGDYVVTLVASDGKGTAGASAIVHIQNTAPTVAVPASATPGSASQVNLSVLGADVAAEGGEAALTYGWFVGASPIGAVVTFDANGTNAAKNAHATVNLPGDYTFTAVIVDRGGLVTTSNASVTITKTISSITLTPSQRTLASNATLQLTAVAKDQFGAALSPQPAFTWAVDGGGSIDQAGLFTGDGISTGTFTVAATSGPVTQTAQITLVLNEAPVFVSPPAASPATITMPNTTDLTADVADPDGVPGLGIVTNWSKVSGFGNVTFTPVSASITRASFSQPGVYTLRVDASDTITTISSTVAVVVNPDPTIPVTVSFQDGVDGYTSEVDLTITTQSQAAYNGMNGNTFRSSTMAVQDTSASGGFIGEGLLRFDNLALPPGAKVLSASLTLNVTTYTVGLSITGRYLNTFWNQAAPQYKIGWINRDSNLLWATPGAAGEGTDLVASKSFTVDGFVSGANQVKTIALDPDVVRGWINNPGSNYGILLKSNAGKNGQVTSSFDTNIARHPKLTIVYEAAIAQTATASPSLVLGNTTALHVLGTSFPAEGGEPSLTYTWSVAPGSTDAPVTFSQNGTNAAKDTVATFTKIGSYGLRVTITDTNGISVVNGVDVQVAATPSLVTISPANAMTSSTQAVSFQAAVIDQFGAAIMPPPVVSWAVSGGGTIDGGGMFVPDGTSGGSFEVSARSGNVLSSTYVTVVQNQAPAISSVTATSTNFALPNGTTLTALASDDDGFPGTGLTYTWSLGSGPAPVTFTPNNSAAAASTAAAFTAPGAYTLHVVVSDGISTTGGDVTVNVAPDPMTPITVSFQQGVNGYTGGVDVTISTQSRAAWNNNNGTLFKAAQLYVQDTSNVTGGFTGKGIVRFNNLGLPTNAVVISATLTLTFATYSPNFNATGRYLLASWDPNAPQYKLGWANRDATHLWTVPGAGGDGSDLVATKSFAISTATTGASQVRTVNLDNDVVQSWIANPSADQGVILGCPVGLSSQFSGATDATVAKRPKLVITYHL
ncbi:MAG: DNRLRE domain-containing protein [Byssovorax sp.]